MADSFVDKKQTIVSDNHVKTDVLVEYTRSVEKNGSLFTCIIRLSNGFEGVGQVSNTYRTGFSDADAQALAHQRAIDYVEMHGYSLV